MRTMQRPFAVVLFVLSVLPAAGCAVAHRYPAYQGRVLELGTDKPIEGAGVLAVYWKWQSGLEAIHNYMAYQAVLTDNTGRFTIPAKTYTTFTPMSWFDKQPRLSIYRKGYGNFPGSFSERRAKRGKTDPPVGHVLPPEGLDKEITFWLPKLETAEEQVEHDKYIPRFNLSRGRVAFPPPGMTKDQFGYFGY